MDLRQAGAGSDGRRPISPRTLARLGPPLLTAVIAVAAAAPSVFPLSSLGTVSDDPADAKLFLWNFWWLRQAIDRLANPLETGLLLYPNGASLALHSYPLPYGLVSLPFQAALPGPTGLVVAFDVIVALSFALSALGAYVLALKATSNRSAAVLAGLIYACMPFHFLNMARLHVLAAEFLVWFVVAWISFDERPGRARAVVVGVVLAATVWTSPEYALAAVGFAGLWAFRSGRWRPRLPPNAMLAAAVALALALPWLLAQALALTAGELSASRSLAEVQSWSPALASFVVPSRVNPFYGTMFERFGDYGVTGTIGMRSETSIALTVWVLAGIGVSRMRRDRSIFWAVAAAVFLVLTLGPRLRLTGRLETNIPLPYLALYYAVPPLRSSRDPTRLLPMVMLMMSILAAFGFRAWLDTLGRRGVRTAALVAVACLLLLETAMPRPTKVPADRLIPDVYRQIAGEVGAVIDLSRDQEAMLAQTLHGLPITSGRVAVPRASSVTEMLPVEQDLRNPDRLSGLDPAARATRLAADRRRLDDLQIRFVVFPVEHPGRALAAELGLKIVARGQPEIWMRSSER
jgi:hypothetical protein